MAKHTDFILSPIFEILNEVVHANAGIGNGMETYPLNEYVMQSAFLRMTGFQEQKMKCICWEMATEDYEFRYEFTRTGSGEFSTYKDKAKVFTDLIAQIEKRNSFTIGDLDIAAIITMATSDVKNVLLHSNIASWDQDSFISLDSILVDIKTEHIATDNKTLFAEVKNQNSIKKIYNEYLIKHRNRCAHNTQSYQDNLPTLKTLAEANHKFHNYFLWYIILIIIDEIFIELYKKYLIAIENH
ncbi:hypothetical protein OQY15_09550 [Pedobacter sp. MC2016-15]|uniref:hypothetical protein n=1 Tax=Pedobacter sp. MC2016-15 TaxID=2994473 RepID=UPI002245E0DD|nr:hypothetical protein [Pedobacter sp. MC2016-15]MCX2479333.1 hypothetical protein [Pedobacter sp. MC2016-15]